MNTIKKKKLLSLLKQYKRNKQIVVQSIDKIKSQKKYNKSKNVILYKVIIKKQHANDLIKSKKQIKGYIENVKFINTGSIRSKKIQIQYIGVTQKNNNYIISYVVTPVEWDDKNIMKYFEDIQLLITHYHKVRLGYILKDSIKQSNDNLRHSYAIIQMIQFKQFINSNGSDSKVFTKMYGGKNNYLKLVKKTLRNGGNRVYVQQVYKTNNVLSALVKPNVNSLDDELIYVPPKYLHKM